MKKVPKLRFPEFEGEWKEKRLGDLGEFFKGSILSKTNLSEEGKSCILYGELYTKYGEVIKDIVSKTDLDSDKLVIGNKNDILIPSSGESAIDIATASCLQREGVILGGDLNVCRIYKDNSVFISYQLNNSKRKEIARLAQGASVVHLYNKQLEKVKVDLPEDEEQDKLANFFSLIGEKIQKQQQKVKTLKEYKKGMMQKIFSQKIRFKDENGKAFPEWKEKRLNELLYEHKMRNYDLTYNKKDVLSVSGEYGIVNQIRHLGRSYAGALVDNYHVVHKGDIVYTKSPLKSNPYGIIKSNKGESGIVSTLYAVYSCKESVLSEYLDYYFQLDDNTNKYVRPLVNKGAKNDMKINNQYFLTDSIITPSLEEQEKIVEFFCMLDNKLGKEQEKLNQLNQWKKGFLQQMFI
jgi:type I restriction enzyme S subunit